jgi:hypothetical protein
LIDLRTPITRAQMKALPMAQLTARYGRTGSLTLLYIAHPTRYTARLYELLPDLGRRWQAVQDDPNKARVLEHHIRGIWSRLVDRSRGYWLCGMGFREYTDA